MNLNSNEVKHNPFTIQLMYDTSEYTLNLEIGVDSGYGYVGISVKSERKEYVSAEYELLKDEKQRHDDRRKYRRTRMFLSTYFSRISK